MDLTPYVAQLREDLTTAASAGDDQTRRTAAVLAAALEPAARLAIMNALSDLAAEVTAALDDRIVEVRLDGRDVRVAVSGGGHPGDHPADEPEPEPEPEPQSAGQSFSDATGDISRITLRLLDEIKAKAEQAANAQGVSLNTFVAQAVQGALNNAGRRGGHHGGRGQWGPPGGWGRGGGWGPPGGWGRDDDEGGSNRVRGWVQG